MMKTSDQTSAATVNNAQMTSDRPDTDRPLLQVDDLRTWFPIRAGVFSKIVGHVQAVDGVSFSLQRGKTLGLVGESGCGKTTVARTVLRLIPATSGRVLFEGTDVLSLPRQEMRQLRTRMQIIFQDPVGSLNPRMTVGQIVGETLRVHRIVSRDQWRDRVAELLRKVGLPAEAMNRYPHEFSGGQRQRIGIARALALNPDLIVCDEPVSALDVSIQSQILNLLQDLQDELHLSYLFIAHNLAVVEHFCDEVAVMYLGKIVEQASSGTLYADPRHPYTQALLMAVPEPDPTKRMKRAILPGEVPSPINPPAGCVFSPRCPFATDQCRQVRPDLRPLPNDPTHLVACHYAEQMQPDSLRKKLARDSQSSQ
jgi:oligopeptide/dipeptide ABC transporter ATP-binding protein